MPPRTPTGRAGAALMASSWDKGSYASDLSGGGGSLSRSRSTPVLRKALAHSITPSQLQRIQRLTREFTESGRSQAGLLPFKPPLMELNLHLLCMLYFRCVNGHTIISGAAVFVRPRA